mmetsp:Transcript_6568/g.6698  ORF Transcript_6568/g.6698 Transcript_6568/m.6698 type:complete len:219 (-) Transcript_6568:92-748(-)|eukprot:CAMPEP_0119040766 /NCGR_PEP_ID=MMETSP1177-20130426/10776_1 /TAXON_ID=2985 /ORGANISM="Ochromonas sp, Strain CCMP1899" /LENGTH=218 /DNA_ID=CAMNT_0007006113 /DNA_START=121 /DNA_END=777 /DNA_ORIENTATION=-
MDKEPCPYRIVDDAGGAFAFGLVGGAIWNFCGGLRNASSGSSRFPQAIARMKARTPILGGSFAIWGTLFSCCDCSFAAVRKKEDPWNAIMSGAATGGILAARGGWRSAGKNALVGGILLAAIEGLNIAVTRVLMPMIEKGNAEEGKIIDMLDPPMDPLRSRIGKRQPLFTPSPEPTRDNSFDVETMPQFGADSWSKDESALKDRNEEIENSKPFYKFW